MPRRSNTNASGFLPLLAEMASWYSTVHRNQKRPFTELKATCSEIANSSSTEHAATAIQPVRLRSLAGVAAIFELGPFAPGKPNEAQTRPGLIRAAPGDESRGDALEARSGLPLEDLLRGLSLRRAARHGVLGHQVAELRMSVAAVLDQQRDQGPHAFDIRTIDDGAALARRAKETRPHQNGQMRGERVVRCADGLGDHVGSNADRFVLHQQPEDRQPGRLS